MKLPVDYVILHASLVARQCGKHNHCGPALLVLTQVFACNRIFIARLDESVPASAVPPESLEVGWFSERDLANLEIWDPSADVDTMRGYAHRVDAR